MLKSLYLRYGWQIGICKPNLEDADDKDISDLTHLIRNKYPHTRSRHEWRFLEHQVHQLSSFDQLLDLTLQPVEELKKFCKERQLILWPSSVSRQKWGTGKLWVGLSSFYEPKEIFRVWKRIIPYLPGFLALTANSPALGLSAGDYKSYRMVRSWTSLSGPAMPLDADSYQQVWLVGDLKAEATGLISTLADCASSPRLVCEYTALFGSLAYALAGKNAEAPIRYAAKYKEYLINRKLAAIDGLQTVFKYDDQEREAVDLIWEIIEIAKPGLKKLGAKAEDLKIINRMLQKRQTQADMALALLNRHNDLHAFYMAYANLISNFKAFEEYLPLAPKLKPRPDTSIEDLVVANMPFKSGYWLLQWTADLPPVLFDRFMRRLKRERKVKTETDVEQGLSFSKN